MTERLLQFIWQFQHFNTANLETDDGETILIIAPGQFNTNQGPDFLNARIRIGTTTWAGNIELHLRTSDWQKHRHQHDKNYANVILHVVWENDQAERNMPLLELQTRVSNMLLHRYAGLMNSSAFVPCESSINSLSAIAWEGWKDHLLVERLLRKAATVEECLQQSNFHWEEVTWWLLARNFGTKVNADAFEAMARSIPPLILSRHKHSLRQIEALLFGQAGLLENEFTGDYPLLEKKEYRFLRSKYGLHPITVPMHFLRMRPGNFPTIRLAQLAILLHRSDHLFSVIKDAPTINDTRHWLDVTASDYWHHHYRFDEPSSYREKRLGSAMTDSIIINTIAPLLFAYGNYYNENRFRERALDWLEQTPAEHNHITAGFETLAIPNKTARDSQAFLELKNEYCDKRRCLDCAVGNRLLKK
jgi:Protein of unknown function (DUF2851)